MITRQFLTELVNKQVTNPMHRSLAAMVINMADQAMLDKVSATFAACIEVVKRQGTAAELLTVAGVPAELLAQLQNGKISNSD